MEKRAQVARVLVAGYYATGSGYPNGRVTEAVLRNLLGLEVINLGYPMPADMPLWKIMGGSRLSAVSATFLFALRNGLSALRVFRIGRRDDIVYVRYPSLPFMLIMACFPRWLRPKCYVDAFISLWETAFVDRAVGKASSSLIARVVHALEGFALRACERVIVDTEANIAFMANEFGISRRRLVSMPLGVDQDEWRSERREVVSASSSFRVLFVGTLIPLHGVSVIADAVGMFDAKECVEFTFVGDGQEAASLIALQASAKVPVSWERDWKSARQLADFVQQADVCLGVFGGARKAARVLPYKLYLYSCLGKAIITQSQLSLPDGGRLPPFQFVESGSAPALATAIRSLQRDLKSRASHATASARYFEDHLSNACLAEAWKKLIADSVVR